MVLLFGGQSAAAEGAALFVAATVVGLTLTRSRRACSADDGDKNGRTSARRTTSKLHEWYSGLRLPPIHSVFDSISLCSSVSAPGKALIAGGYLVLEKENIGITVAASSRFYSTVAVLVRQSPEFVNASNCKVLDLTNCFVA
jgi:hypothetical protein